MGLPSIQPESRKTTLAIVGMVLLTFFLIVDLYIAEESALFGKRGASLSSEEQEKLLNDIAQVKVSQEEQGQLLQNEKTNQDAIMAQLKALVEQQDNVLNAHIADTEALQQKIDALEAAKNAAVPAAEQPTHAVTPATTQPTHVTSRLPPDATAPVADPVASQNPGTPADTDSRKDNVVVKTTPSEDRAARAAASICTKNCDVENKHVTGRKYLVFSSVGDFSHAEFWLDQGEDRDFDVIVAYYGDKDEWALADKVDHVFHRKDGKFGNTQWLALNQPDVFLSYDAVFVMDDDIQITSQDINTLFDLRQCYQLSAIAPAFEPYHRSFLSLARQHPHEQLRLVEFIEMNAPMFEAQVLYDWLTTEFDPMIVGWGADLWYIDFIQRRNGIMAVADQVKAENPLKHDSGQREIDVLQPADIRAQTWRAFAAEHDLPVEVPISAVKKNGAYQSIATGPNVPCRPVSDLVRPMNTDTLLEVAGLFVLITILAVISSMWGAEKL